MEIFLMSNKEDDFIEMFVKENTMVEYTVNGVEWIWQKYE